MPQLSLVIPVYHCAGCLKELHRRLGKTLGEMKVSYEIIFVEDGGKDSSWEVLKDLCQKDPKTTAFRLSRNFGQHAAITAGLSQCSGDWAVVMDCDLQDQPEEIPLLFQKTKEGFDIVLTKRVRKKQNLYRNLAARLYFFLMNIFNNKAMDGSVGSFSIISRKVIDAYLSLGDMDRHYLFILRWLGFQTATLEYQHTERFSGKSSYHFRSLISHAFNGLFFQTTRLLRWIIYLGLGISFSGFLLALYFVFLYFYRSIPPGWTSLATLILIIGGFIIVSTGITGLYIGKIFEQVKQRPLFIFDRQAGKKTFRMSKTNAPKRKLHG